MERAAKLKQQKSQQSIDTTFKPIFESKKFEESSGEESSDSESDSEDQERFNKILNSQLTLINFI